jgi:hypothetical protein
MLSKANELQKVIAVNQVPSSQVHQTGIVAKPTPSGHQIEPSSLPTFPTAQTAAYNKYVIKSATLVFCKFTEGTGNWCEVDKWPEVDAKDLIFRNGYPI